MVMTEPERNILQNSLIRFMQKQV